MERVGKGWDEMKQKAPQKSQGLALKSNLNVSGLRLSPVLGVPGYFWAPRRPWRCFIADVRLLGGQTLSEMRAVKLLKSFPVCNSSLCSGRSGSRQTEVGRVHSYASLLASCARFQRQPGLQRPLTWDLWVDLERKRGLLLLKRKE